MRDEGDRGSAGSGSGARVGWVCRSPPESSAICPAAIKRGALAWCPARVEDNAWLSAAPLGPTSRRSLQCGCRKGGTAPGCPRAGGTSLYTLISWDKQGSRAPARGWDRACSVPPTPQSFLPVGSHFGVRKAGMSSPSSSILLLSNASSTTYLLHSCTGSSSGQSLVLAPGSCPRRPG